MDVVVEDAATTITTTLNDDSRSIPCVLIRVQGSCPRSILGKECCELIFWKLGCRYLCQNKMGWLDSLVSSTLLV